MSVMLQEKDWDGVERYAAALEDFTAEEPLPWSDLALLLTFSALFSVAVDCRLLTPTSYLSPT